MATNYQDFQTGGSSNQLPTIYLSDSVIVGGTVITSNSIASIGINEIAYPSGGSALPAGGQTITLTGTYFEVGVTLTVGGSSVAVTRVSITSATFTSPAKSAGTYNVVLTNPDGTSASINILYALGVPGAPTIGTATTTGTTTATVAFTAPASDGGSTITTYTATSSPGGVTGTVSQAGSGTITVNGLTPLTTYTFTVTATNGVGTSTASSASNSITTFATPVNTVAPVVSGTASFGSTLSTTDGTWTGTATITYTYQWQRASADISGATSSTYTLVAADVGNAIRCVVTGTNSYGNASANSNATSAVVAIAPGAPTIGTATATNATTATVSFTAPASNGGATITSYTATSTPGNITGTLSQSGSGTITVTGLTQLTSYTFTVTATNSVGTSSPSSASNSITTPSAGPTTIGQSFGGGYYAGQISTAGNGVADYYLIVAPYASGNAAKQWQNTSVTTPGTNSVIDGPANSTAMNDAAHQAALFCKGLTIGGYTDWYMPAMNELEVCYYNLKPSTTSNSTSGGANPNAVPSRGSNYTSGTPSQTTAADFQTTGAEDFQLTNYWSSTQHPTEAANARTISFNNGAQSRYGKDTARITRAVRRVAV